MKKVRMLAALWIMAAAAAPAWAQTSADLGHEWGGRLQMAVDYKLYKGLHLNLEEEARLDNSFRRLARLQTSAGLDYKVLRNLKVGVGYALINPYDADSSTFKNARHRLMLDATGSMRYGAWHFALKERLQFTRRTGSFNAYQNPRTSVMLKSRIQVKYKGFRNIEPYLSAEVRHYLNAPTVDAVLSDSTWVDEEGNKKDDEGWFLLGFNTQRVNRYRLSLGADYHLDRHQTFSLSAMLDRTIDEVVDANSEGTKLLSWQVERGCTTWICLGYEYDF